MVFIDAQVKDFFRVDVRESGRSNIIIIPYFVIASRIMRSCTVMKERDAHKLSLSSYHLGLKRCMHALLVYEVADSNLS